MLYPNIFCSISVELILVVRGVGHYVDDPVPQIIKFVVKCGFSRLREA